MNPYDFVRTDWETPPDRKAPKLHHKFYSDTVSGKIECRLTAETVLFVPTSDSEGSSKQYFSSHRNEFGSREEGAFFIPGSSLKGMLRSLVEAVGNGCYSKFAGEYKQAHYFDKLPHQFQRCLDKSSLCIGCRLFGFLEKQNVFKGLVQIGDAEFLTGEKYGKFILHSIGGPNPHHDAFYLTVDKKRISGRKFYFHFMNPLTGKESDFNAPVIYPLKPGAIFNFKIHFTNLTQSELNTLLYAIVLEENMRHKIGYAKPLGLGSVKTEIIELILIDYNIRYAAQQDPTQPLIGAQLTKYLDKNLNSFKNNQSITFKDLRRIWRWPPPEGIRYEYPSYEWFKEDGNSQIRLNEIL